MLKWLSLIGEIVAIQTSRTQSRGFWSNLPTWLAYVLKAILWIFKFAINAIAEKLIIYMLGLIVLWASESELIAPLMMLFQ
ncbi:MAG: hypothetical protein ACSHXK_17060 [Oceanococcus sp.]